jgi:large subunit ribosomal protein L19
MEVSARAKRGCVLLQGLHYPGPLFSPLCVSQVAARRESRFTLLSAMHPLIAKINQDSMKKELPSFNVGDTVKVHTKIIEGAKERIQIFAGIVIDRNGGEKLGGSFTVRKIAYGEGVERVFPIHSPRVDKVEVTKAGKVRRAKLSYLRGRVGKEATTVKEADR